MTYREYVIAAYAVFALVLAWDFIVPQLQVRSALRSARLRGSRTTARKPTPTELQR